MIAEFTEDCVWCGGDPVDYDESTVFVSHVGYLLRSQVVCQCGARAPFGTPTGDGLIAARRNARAKWNEGRRP